MPKLSEYLFGKKDKVKQQKLTSPLQDELLQLIKEGLTSGQGPFANLFGNQEFDQEAFDKGVTEPALKNFQEKILPMLQEKFIAGGQLGGSGQERAFSQAGTDLQSELAKLLYQAKTNEKENQQKNQLAGINASLGVQPFENIYKKGYGGLVNDTISSFAQGAGKAAGMAAFG